MTSSRIQDHQKRLERNRSLVLKTFSNVRPGGWSKTVYEEPTPWTLRDLLAHFVSAERALRELAENIAAGGEGAPEGFDYNAFNRREQNVYRAYSPEELLRMFSESRDSLLEWSGTLTAEQLDRKGRHPAWGEVTLSDVLSAVHGHTLLHIRDL